MSEDPENLAEIATVVCYQNVAHNFSDRSRWRVRATEPRGKGKGVVILARVETGRALLLSNVVDQ